ncbi:hypothetical protein GA0061102_105831 [Rhizobium miluonense]|uniref:Uncharacterized protein n=1 Tax=Rhizobium miluonense TaxID=411945 RepID=A0A1C3X546_9HYPH|nr:hypothetical protein GA0061102_105831 [Rhizobium miluonense]
MPGMRRATVLASSRITIRKVMWDIAKLSASVSEACREFDHDLNRKEEACSARHCGNRRAVGDSAAARSAGTRGQMSDYEMPLVSNALGQKLYEQSELSTEKE